MADDGDCKPMRLECAERLVRVEAWQEHYGKKIDGIRSEIKQIRIANGQRLADIAVLKHTAKTTARLWAIIMATALTAISGIILYFVVGK